MLYKRNQDGELQRYSLKRLREDNSQVSFPLEITDVLAQEYDLVKVARAPEPFHDPETQMLEEADQPELVDGAYVLGWVVLDRVGGGASRKAYLEGLLEDELSLSPVLLKVAFDQENRLRELEQRPAVSVAQFTQFVKNQID